MKYRMNDGTIINTQSASKSFHEDTRWDGNNHISINTGSQWNHQTLYRSRKGRYYIVYDSQWKGSTPHAEWVSPEEAVRWLELNCEDIPAELQQYIDSVTE